MVSFAPIYAGLNVEQKRAVDTVEGPVMVIAGPGTGKTQVLAVRVANILKKTHAKPGNILCLTFSNAGTVAMRDRLRQLIGADAYAVTVNTVHGFSDQLIRRHTAAFSEWSELTAFTDLERVKLMEKLIDKVSDNSPLIHPKNPYHRIPDILSRISDVKREGKTLEDLRRVADVYEKEMAEKSRAGTKADAKNRLQAEKFRSFVDLFERYEDARKDAGKYDYDDMILTVLDALKTEDWLLASLQERYQYILVDEAQDLNGAQWKVIEALTTYEALPHDPNLFIVGDDDQSIYRFQGANTAELLSFHKKYPKAPVIVLTQNYRSTQPILDAAGSLISHNEERLVGMIPDLTKDLHAQTKEKGVAPTLLRPPSDTAEPWLIADLVQDRLKQGIPAEEIAILVQTNRELRPIYDVLRARELPVVLFGKADLLTHPLILQVTTILRSLVSESDQRLLSALGCNCFGVHPADLARVSLLSREDSASVTSVLLEAENAKFTDADALLRARDLLFDLRNKVASRTVLENVETVIRDAKLITPMLDPLDTATVEAFFGYVKDASLGQPDLTLQALLRDLELYADENYSQVRLTYQLPHLVTSGVQLLTAHQSKGLEFHTVMLSGFREGHWDERTARSGLSIPEELLFGWQAEQKRAEKHQDERRVAYVAMTRAKRELIFLCPYEFSVGERVRPVSPSAFFAEAGKLPEESASLRSPETSSLLLHTPVRSIDDELKAYLHTRLEDFWLSPSALTSFLIDPQIFLRQHLLGLPEELTDSNLRAFGYGNAVHWALRKWAEHAREKKVMSNAELLDQFSWYLHERTVLTETQRRDLFSEAKHSLPRYSEARLRDFGAHIHAVEHDYRATIGDLRLRGKIDRIDRVSSTSADAIIFDFKTGRPKTPAQIRGSAEEGTVSWGADGDNFRQLVFYALLLEHAEPLLHPQAFVLEFIGERDEEPVRREFQITESEKKNLRDLLSIVWVKIHALDFSPLNVERSSPAKNKEDGLGKPKSPKTSKKVLKKG